MKHKYQKNKITVMDLVNAIINNDIYNFRLLLEKYKDKINDNIYIRYYGRTTLLYYACKFEHIEIIKLLLTYKHIDVNKRVDLSPLCIACYLGNLNIVNLLLMHKNIYINGMYNHHPIYFACKSKNFKIVKLLLKHKKNILDNRDILIIIIIYLDIKAFTKIFKLLLKNKLIKINNNKLIYYYLLKNKIDSEKVTYFLSFNKINFNLSKIKYKPLNKKLVLINFIIITWQNENEYK